MYPLIIEVGSLGSYQGVLHSSSIVTVESNKFPSSRWVCAGRG